jgi:hypothetical protein
MLCLDVLEIFVFNVILHEVVTIRQVKCTVNVMFPLLIAGFHQFGNMKLWSDQLIATD